jgi:hypothetical protein
MKLPWRERICVRVIGECKVVSECVISQMQRVGWVFLLLLLLEKNGDFKRRCVCRNDRNFRLLTSK